MNGSIDFFCTLHNESKPTGHLGRGTHYSIFRSLAWVDHCLQSLSQPVFHDLAVIWDEDHDERVLEVVHALYLRGILSPALFIGERKGSLTVMLADDCEDAIAARVSAEVEDICQSLIDPWSSYVFSVSQDEGRIINDAPERIAVYLQCIQMLWRLGLKPIPATPTDENVT